MPQITLLSGAVLIVLGVVSFYATGAQHATALIPTWAGIAFGVLGVVALRPGARKHAMHGVAMLSLLGALGTARALVPAVRWIGGTEPARPAAVIAQSLMFGLCLLLLVLCIRSFIVARILRRVDGPGPVEGV